MKEQEKSIVENYINAYNSFDIDGMVKNLSDDVVFENVSNGNVELRTEGIAEFKKQAEKATQYFTQRKQTIKSWDFMENKVIIRIAYEATLAIDLPNGLKKGEILKLDGTSDFQFKGHQIACIVDRV